MPLKEYTEFLPNEVCSFCKLGVASVLYGPIYKCKQKYRNSPIVVHYFCLLMSSKVQQNGQDNQGILGFFPKDIITELERGRNLSCCFCNRKGATVHCVHKGCDKVFHLPCGVDKGSVHQFFDLFNSHCPLHRPNQIIPPSLAKTMKDICIICSLKVDCRSKYDSVWPPCCKPSVFIHRKCIQIMANNAGYYFKCPLCNNADIFKKEMKRIGIYVPDQEASWESEPHAYSDLLVRGSGCESTTCVCPKGKDYSKKCSLWQLELCKVCGGNGTHLGCCSKWKRNKGYQFNWICQICKPVYIENKAYKSPDRLVNEDDAPETVHENTRVDSNESRPSTSANSQEFKNETPDFRSETNVAQEKPCEPSDGVATSEEEDVVVVSEDEEQPVTETQVEQPKPSINVQSLAIQAKPQLSAVIEKPTTEPLPKSPDDSDDDCQITGVITGKRFSLDNTLVRKRFRTAPWAPSGDEVQKSFNAVVRGIMKPVTSFFPSDRRLQTTAQNGVSGPRPDHHSPLFPLSKDPLEKKSQRITLPLNAEYNLREVTINKIGPTSSKSRDMLPEESQQIINLSSDEEDNSCMKSNNASSRLDQQPVTNPVVVGATVRRKEPCRSPLQIEIDALNTHEYSSYAAAGSNTRSSSISVTTQRIVSHYSSVDSDRLNQNVKSSDQSLSKNTSVKRTNNIPSQPDGGGTFPKRMCLLQYGSEATKNPQLSAILSKPITYRRSGVHPGFLNLQNFMKAQLNGNIAVDKIKLVERNKAPVNRESLNKAINSASTIQVILSSDDEEDLVNDSSKLADVSSQTEMFSCSINISSNCSKIENEVPNIMKENERCVSTDDTVAISSGNQNCKKRTESSPLSRKSSSGSGQEIPSTSPTSGAVTIIKSVLKSNSCKPEVLTVSDDEDVKMEVPNTSQLVRSQNILTSSKSDAKMSTEAPMSLSALASKELSPVVREVSESPVSPPDCSQNIVISSVMTLTDASFFDNVEENEEFDYESTYVEDPDQSAFVMSHNSWEQNQNNVDSAQTLNNSLNSSSSDLLGSSSAKKTSSCFIRTDNPCPAVANLENSQVILNCVTELTQSNKLSDLVLETNSDICLKSKCGNKTESSENPRKIPSGSQYKNPSFILNSFNSDQVVSSTVVGYVDKTKSVEPGQANVMLSKVTNDSEEMVSSTTDPSSPPNIDQKVT